MDNREINEKYKEIGDKLIETEPELINVANSNVRITYLSSDYRKTEKGKVIFGQCEKVANKYKWGIPCEFTITIFEPNVEYFTGEQIEILIFHELLHIGVEFNSDGTESYSIKAHDLEDFKVIIDKYGTEWANQ